MISSNKFVDNFWGEKNNGFEILCANLKHSLNSVKELEAYFRECANVEDQYVRLTNKLASQSAKYNSQSSNGTFNAIWAPIKELNEKIATTHTHTIHQLHELAKETQRYGDEFGKKIKKFRDLESPTQLAVQSFQEATSQLHKSKEQYHSIALELEKQRRAENSNVQRLEKKLKQAADEYRLNIERYNVARAEFEKKFTDSCENFQLHESAHLKQMRIFVENYVKLLLKDTQTLQGHNQEFYNRFQTLTADSLIQTFIDLKRTGSERPEAASIAEPDYSKLGNASINSSSATAASVSSNLLQTGTEPHYNQLNNSAINSSMSNLNSELFFANEAINTTSLPTSVSSTAVNSVNNGSNLLANQGMSTTSLINTAASSTNGSIANMPLILNPKETSTIVSTSAGNKGMSALANTSTSSSNSSSTTANETAVVTSSNNMKKSDSKPFNIFNVDIFDRKNRKKNNKKVKASGSEKDKDKDTAKKEKDCEITLSSTPTPNFGKDNNSINSEDSMEKPSVVNTANVRVQPATSLDLLNNGSDVDSEGFSIRPETKEKKEDEDMTNFYGRSSTSDSDTDSEQDFKIKVKINPLNEAQKPSTSENANLLIDISKNLKLKPLASLADVHKNSKKRAGAFSGAGGSEQENSDSPQSSSIFSSHWPSNPVVSSGGMTRSVSAITTSNHFTDAFGATFNFSAQTSASMPPPPPPPPLAQATTLPFANKPHENHLYNIDEDKEVESSFQAKKTLAHTNSTQSSNTPTAQLHANSNNIQAATSIPSANPSTTTAMNNVPGRYTPACFPGRTTPDFRHTTSFFENSTRAIASPLTINGSNIIPFAVAFNETLHAYFKVSELTKHKVKCFGCMKISFPFAILKILAIELPQLEFRLSNLNIQNQDLIINNALITRSLPDSLQFHFNSANLIKELRDQHQQNKQAAFFNFELLKYELKYTDSPPLMLNATWEIVNEISEKSLEIEFRLDYTHNFSKKLTNVNFMLVLIQQPLNYAISMMKSEPNALVQDADLKLQVLWQIMNLDASGRLSAKFVINFMTARSQSVLDSIFQQPIYAKFQIDNQTLSHVKFDILSPNYKLSLLKERVESGKYFCAPTFNNSSVKSPDVNGTNGNGSSTKSAAIAAGSLSTSIGSSVDILFNC